MHTKTADARLSLAFSGISGAIGVAAGAWASHAGAAAIGSDMVRLVEIGARYQLVHTLALLGCAGVSLVWPGRPVRLAALLFAVGTILFSGSLYLLAATGASAVATVTPFGGACFIAGWLTLTVHALRVPQ